MEKKHSSLRIWWQAFRYHFVPPSMFPVILGALVSWSQGLGFSLWYFFLVLFAVIINHIALNMTDDYFDFIHAVDHYGKDKKNPYTGGSGTLTQGLIQPVTMKYVFSLMYLIVIFIGIYLSIMRGWFVLVFGILGIVSSIFYTAPPLKLSHHGLGEITMLLNFSVTLGLGSFYVQAQLINLEALIAILPCGIMLFSMIIINEIPDINEDTQAGKLTLVARYGSAVALKLFIASWLSTYFIIILGVVFNILPLFCLLALLSVPLVVHTVFILQRYLTSSKNIVQANFSMILAHSVTSFGLIVGYIYDGLIKKADITSLWFIILLVSLVYIPAILPLLIKKPR